LRSKLAHLGVEYREKFSPKNAGLPGGVPAIMADGAHDSGPTLWVAFFVFKEFSMDKFVRWMEKRVVNY
jgi:hypothetical protein